MIDPAARMGADVAELALEDRHGWTGDALSARLVELLELRERLDAAVVGLAGQWRHRRGWEADGALSGEAWLGHHAPLGAAEARHLMKTAKLLEAAPRLADSLHAGETTTAHVGALARVMSPRRYSLLAEHEAVLREQAEVLSIKDFNVLVRRWAAVADDHLAADDHDEHQPRNELNAAVTMDGWIDGKFRMDPVSGATLLATLDHLAPPDPVDAPDGARTLAGRRGDALADLAAWYHQGGEPGTNPPNVDVVVDIVTLNGDPVDLVRGRCELAGIGPITRATLERLGCGATLRRVVMAGESVILDMGRKVRFATPAQARAIRIRDRGCIFPSCNRPARWCDIHHCDEFANGGHTDVGRMCCLCRRHHTLVHNSQWTVEVNADGTFRVTHPARAP